MERQPMSGPRRWRHAQALGGALLGGALLWSLLHQVRGLDWASVLNAPALPLTLPVAAALWLLSYGLRAWRLRAEWPGHPGVDLWGCWRAVMRHNVALAVLPMRLGEAGYLWLLRHDWGIGWAEAARSLLWLRLQDLTLLSLLALLALAGPAWAASAGLAGLAAGWTLHRWRPRHPWAPRARLAQALARLVPALQRSLARPDQLTGWACCAGSWLAKLTATTLMLQALCGAAAPLAPLWRAALAGEWAGALPLQAPAGLGTYEAALLWGAQGAAAAPTLIAAALLTHACALATLLLAATLSAPWPARRALPTPVSSVPRIPS